MLEGDGTAVSIVANNGDVLETMENQVIRQPSKLQLISDLRLVSAYHQLRATSRDLHLKLGSNRIYAACKSQGTSGSDKVQRNRNMQVQWHKRPQS